MPYAPGIQDISGQLLAQGIGQAANAYAQKVGSISNAVTGFMQTYQQNQMMTSQAMGKFQGALRSDPALQKYIQDAASDDPNAPKLSPELQKAIDNVKAGKVDVYDSAVLSNFIDTWGANKQRQAQQQHIQAQTDLLKQQLAEAQKTSSFFDNLMAGAQPQGQMAAPAPQAAVPASVPYYLARPGAPEAAQPPAQAIQAVQAAQAAQGVQPSGAPTERDAAIRLFAATGKRPTPAQVVSELRLMNQEFRKNQASEQLYDTEQQATAAAKSAQQSGAFPQGTIPVTKRDATSGKWYFETTPSAYETSEQSARRTGMETESKELAQGAVKFLDGVSQKAIDATTDLYRVNKAIALLESGVPTGPLTPELLKVTSLLVEQGFLDAEAAKKVTKGEELQSLLGQGALAATQRWLKGGGSVSDAERDRVDVVAENARKQPGTNLELLKTMQGVYAKDRAADDYRRQLRKQGLSSVQIKDRLEDWINDDANSLDRFMGRVQSPRGVKELSIVAGKPGQTKVTVQSGSPAAAETAEEMYARLSGKGK